MRAQYLTPYNKQFYTSYINVLLRYPLIPRPAKYPGWLYYSCCGIMYAKWSAARELKGLKNYTSVHCISRNPLFLQNSMLRQTHLLLVLTTLRAWLANLWHTCGYTIELSYFFILHMPPTPILLKNFLPSSILARTIQCRTWMLCSACCIIKKYVCFAHLFWS